MEKTITDGRGHILGRLSEQGNEIHAIDKNGRQVGRYSKSDNATFDAHGHRIGSGNQLEALLKK